MQCQFCHAALAPDAKFCRACGKSLTKICQHCGKPNGIAARFCVGCGHAFSDNTVNGVSTEDAGTGSPRKTPSLTPPVPQTPHTFQDAEPENAAPSYASSPAITRHPSENKSVSEPGSSTKTMGLETDRSLSTPTAGLKRAALVGNAPHGTSVSPRGRWKFAWIGIPVIVVVAGSAGGYYLYSGSSNSPGTNAAKATQTAELAPAQEESVLKSATSALPEIKASEGTADDSIEGLAVDEAEQIMARGERVYLKHCSACHQVNGRGVPNVFPAIDGSRIVTGNIDKHILVVMDGRPSTAMVGFSEQLSDAEIAAVVTYQRNAWSNSDSDALLDPSYVKQFRRPINKPLANTNPVKPKFSVNPAAPVARAPEKPKGIRELLIGRWRMAGGIIEYRLDGSTQGYREDGSPLNTGWWRLESDRLTIGWVRNGRKQEAGCTVLGVNARELLCQNEREVQRATRMAREDQPQRQVEQPPQPVARIKEVTNSIEQIFNRELEKLKQCEGKWGTTPECPASSWSEE